MNRQPGRVASWWSTAEDLCWPEKRIRDKIQRRADALAEAAVDTVIQFGFHLRFDLAQHLGAVHDYLAAVAGTLHDRGLRFLDHYSCNLVARPRSTEDRLRMHRWQRHHVLIYPDAEARSTAGYAGFRFDDLRMIDVETGLPAYCPTYQTELSCPNNPGFQAMHESYIRRLVADVPVDGLQVDDMARYVLFRACGCRFCRERFRSDYGRELPSLTDISFWGDIGRNPVSWGNYDNPAFRDWVRMGYQSYSDHLAMIKRMIGTDRVLFTCCEGDGPNTNNATGACYGSFTKSCDWVFYEIYGLSGGTVKWMNREPDVLLQKALARAKPGAATVACGYYIYEDGAYLGWAMARFWGVSNWSSTLHHRLEEDPPDMREEADLVGPYNRWERDHGELGPGEDMAEARIVFARHARENGWRDEQGRDHWTRASAWARTLSERDIGFRFVRDGELTDGALLAADRTPLILDGCSHLNDAQARALEEFLLAGGELWVSPPLGEWDAEGERRQWPVLEYLRGLGRANLRVIEPPCADRAPDILDIFAPRLRRVAGPGHWAVRLLLHNGRPAVHLLNRALTPVLHPTIRAWADNNVLLRIEARQAEEPLVLELRKEGLPGWPEKPALFSPELDAARPVSVERVHPGIVLLTLDLSSLRLYAVVHGNDT